ncbi:MAG: DNA polymerase Y family protein [Rhodospirillaceae bacterium]|nr:DNA polymerase Y family protein [Rhodospirillaceae bacterium]
MAAAAGLTPGLPLAEARAIVPDLVTRSARPDRDAARLAALADWCERYSPLVGVTGAPAAGEGGVLIDIAGSAHLFGGEAALLDDLVDRLGRFGHAARAAVAGTPAAAWAVARVGPGHATPGWRAAAADIARAIVPAGSEAAALAALPLEGLRLGSAAVAALGRVGIRRIGELAGLPRAALARRYGEAVVTRLDQALGRRGEPISPRRPVPRFAARMVFAEPIGRSEDVAAALDRLLARLCRDLAEAGLGARGVDLTLFRVDGLAHRCQVGTVRPVDRAGHLARLLALHLDGLDAGFGFDAMALAAPAVESMAAVQGELVVADACAPARPVSTPLAELVDRLANRLGTAAVRRRLPRQSHLPDRAVADRPALAAPGAAPGASPGAAPDASLPAAWPVSWPDGWAERPVRLLARPQPLDAVAPVPDDPPVLLRREGHSHRILRAAGPERLSPEWWLAPERGDLAARTRDYYRVEDAAGRRFWVVRVGGHAMGRPARWYLHGLFA